MNKPFSFPSSGIVRTRLRFDWHQLPGRIRDWFRQSRRGIVFGTLIGLTIAAIYSLLILLQVAARRSIWFYDVQLSAWQIVAGYFTAFAIAGAIVGSFAPALRWRWVAVVAGMLAGTLVYGFTQLSAFRSPVLALLGAVQPGVGIGGPVGYLLHYQLLPERRWSQVREVLSILSMGVMLVIVELLVG